MRDLIKFVVRNYDFCVISDLIYMYVRQIKLLFVVSIHVKLFSVRL